jgi:hypothetical protein
MKYRPASILNKIVKYLPDYSVKRSISLFLIIYSLYLVFAIPDTPWMLSHSLVPDDAFYYVNIALNTWSYGYPTFDGLTATNGFHPLWYILLLPITLLSHVLSLGPGNTVILVLFFQVLLISISSSLLVDYISRSFSVGILSTFTAVLVLFTSGIPVWLNGMEGSLLILLISLLIWGSSKECLRTPLYTGLILGAIFLARMDAIFFISFFILFLLINEKKKYSLKVLLYFIPFFATTVIVNYLLFSHIVPISGAVKSFWGKEVGLWYNYTDPFTLSYSLLRYVAIGVRQTFYGANIPFLDKATFIYTQSPSGIVTIKVLLISVSSVIYYFFFLFHKKNESLFIPITLIAGYAVQIAYTKLFSFHAGVFLWYFALCLSALSLPVSVFMSKAIDTTFTKLGKIVFLVVILSTVTFSLHRESQSWPTPYGKLYQKMAHRLDSTSSGEFNVGGWAVGHIGYFSNQGVTNLEGLVSNNSVLRANKNGNIPSLILRFNIGYLVNHFPQKDPFSGPQGEYDFFWNLRLDPIKRNSSCFDTLHKIDGEVSDGYVLKVDRDCLRKKASISRNREYR